MKKSEPSERHPNKSYYNWLAYKLLDKQLLQVVKYISGDLLDVGSGEQVYKSFLEEYSKTYTSLDWQSSQHEVEPDIKADLNRELPLESRSYDTVFMISVIEHLSNPLRAIQEIDRIMRLDGKLIVQVPWMWRTHEEPFDYFRFTPYALEELMKGVNLEIIYFEAMGSIFTTVALKMTYFFARLNRPASVWRRLGFIPPLCYVIQRVAIVLERYDGDRTSEATGYFLVAKKSSI